VISTRGFEDRLQTIENVRKTNVTVCSGGIIGMGESVEDRAGMLVALHIKPATRIRTNKRFGSREGTPMEEANRSR
jgi:biotin synthase